MSLMKDPAFTIGTAVFAIQTRGTIVDVRATPSGKWIFGVEDADGVVHYFTQKALKHVQN